jgi:UDP:flavonoid glycosyltransferase YjiC (YdhE family)
MRALLTVSGGFGHLLPLVPLALSLRDRGADVAIAVPDYFRDETSTVGLPVISLMAAGVGPPSREFKAAQQARPPYERGRPAIGRYLQHAVALMSSMRAAATDWAADVLVRDTTAFAAWFAGEALGVPVAVLDHAGTPGRLLAATMGDLMEETRRAVGLGPDPRLASLNRWLHLLAAPAGWYAPISFGPTTYLFQPPGDLPAEEPPCWFTRLGSSVPFVYATLGTLHNDTPQVFEAILTVLASEPVRALATIGPDADPASFGPLPAHIRVQRFVPQAAVLPYADAVICHCGYGSIMSPLRHGIPLVVLPLPTGDSAAVAARVERFGVGVVVREGDWTPAAVREGLHAVLHEPRYRDAARRVADSITTLPPLSEAAPLIERLARTRQPVRNPRFGR